MGDTARVDRETAARELIVREIRWESGDILLLTLEDPHGKELPAWIPGAHIDLRLPHGVERQYSLCSDPAETGRWQVAVLKEEISRGGSHFVHDTLRAGDQVHATGPRNNFPLVEADETVLVAGGIGITPILSMVRELAKTDRSWRLAYLGRDATRMAFLDSPLLQQPQVTVMSGQSRLDLAEWIGSPGSGDAVYVCGPTRMLDAVEELSGEWPSGVLHLERFSPKRFEDTGDGSTFEVIAQQSGLQVTVEPQCSILETLERAGIEIPSSCLEGICGTCETGVIDGDVEHRDSILDADERAANDTMMICVSRSRLPTLVLNI